jgi:hypothetical protein
MVWDDKMTDSALHFLGTADGGRIAAEWTGDMIYKQLDISGLGYRRVFGTTDVLLDRMLERE